MIKKRDFLFCISMAACLFMKASFQHSRPTIEICFASKTGKSLNKKDELRSIKNASLNKSSGGCLEKRIFPLLWVAAQLVGLGNQ